MEGTWENNINHVQKFLEEMGVKKKKKKKKKLHH